MKKEIILNIKSVTDWFISRIKMEISGCAYQTLYEFLWWQKFIILWRNPPMVAMQKLTTRLRALTIGWRCPGILSDMYLPVIFVKRLNRGIMLLPDYYNPFPSQPFEVVSMDFIPELPLSSGFDNILVIVDKLMKYSFQPLLQCKNHKIGFSVQPY